MTVTMEHFFCKYMYMHWIIFQLWSFLYNKNSFFNYFQLSTMQSSGKLLNSMVQYAWFMLSIFRKFSVVLRLLVFQEDSQWLLLINTQLTHARLWVSWSHPSLSLRTPIMSTRLKLVPSKSSHNCHFLDLLRLLANIKTFFLHKQQSSICTVNRSYIQIYIILL